MSRRGTVFAALALTALLACEQSTMAPKDSVSDEFSAGANLMAPPGAIVLDFEDLEGGDHVMLAHSPYNGVTFSEPGNCIAIGCIYQIGQIDTEINLETLKGHAEADRKMDFVVSGS